MDLHAAALNFLIDAVLHDAPARRHGDDGPRVDRKPDIAAFVDVAASAVDDDSAELFLFGSERKQSAPSRYIGTSAVVDDDDVALFGRFDRRRAEADFRFFQTRRFDFAGDGAADDARARPHWPDADGRAAETQTVERVGCGAGVELGKAAYELIHLKILLVG